MENVLFLGLGTGYRVNYFVKIYQAMHLNLSTFLPVYYILRKVYRLRNKHVNKISKG